MKMTDLLAERTLKWMPVAFHFFRPIDKMQCLFADKYVPVKSYQSHACAVHPPLKPISRML
jgi:glycyl-tRNA synthetase beta subunit